MYKVLFLCSGNICRSPLAEGIFRKLLTDKGLDSRIEVSSAGTHGMHAGEAPDPRTIKTAEKHGYSLGGITAEQIDPLKLRDYKLVVCMDSSHYQFVMERCHPDDESRVKLFLHYHTTTELDDVPDPYYGEEDGFEEVFELIEQGCRQFLETIESQVLAT